MMVYDGSPDECQKGILKNPFLSFFSTPTFEMISIEKLRFITEPLHVLPYILSKIPSSKIHHL